MSAIHRFADAQTVFGQSMSPDELVARIRTFQWQGAFLRLAHLAARVARDHAGPASLAVGRWAREALLTLTGPAGSLIAHARAWAASGDDAAVVHEEAIDFVQHLVLLHGQEEGDVPGDAELVLWLLGASDSLGTWERADARKLSSNEEMIAEMARVHRFNNSGGDPLLLIVRIRELFGAPPFTGGLADPDIWSRIEHAAFGCSFAEHFETRVLPFFSESLSWGETEERLPLIVPGQWVRNLSAERAESISRWVFSHSKTREELVGVTRQRMRSDGLLPHAPTALLRHPIVRLLDDRVGIASPWRVHTHLTTGIWAAFMQATKDVLGAASAQEWSVAFGYRFEEWMRVIARHAATSGQFRGEVVLPEHPGSDDEIEDVVVIEGDTAVLFSGKARLMEESVARHARSRDAVIDWYSKFFFAPRDGKFRDGVVKQLSARVDTARAGQFEPTLPRTHRIVPVLVTYDSLCEEFPLYEWLTEQCGQHGLLQQPDVAPLVLAHVDDFERLMGRAARGESIVAFMRERETSWADRRLNVQLGTTRAEERLPQLVHRFEELMDAMKGRLSA